MGVNLPYTGSQTDTTNPTKGGGAQTSSTPKDPNAPKDPTAANPFVSFAQPMGSSSTDASGNTTTTPFAYGAGTYSNTNPNGAGVNATPGNVAPITVAQTRTGITSGVSPDLNSVAANLYNPNLNVSGPNIDLNTQGNKYGVDTNNLYSTSMDPNYASAYAAKANLGAGDFGIPAAIQDKMKAQEAQTIGRGYDQQAEAAKRMLARAGLTNDAASTKMGADINQAKMGDIAKSYNNIDVQNAIEANKQRMQNLQDLLTSSSQASQVENAAKGNVMQNLLGQGQLGEQGRQFNVGGEMDMGRLDRATQQWLEQSGQNRATLNESVAEYLQNLDLERQKAAAGLVGSAPQTASNRINELQTAFGAVPATGGFGSFASGTSGMGG